MVGRGLDGDDIAGLCDSLQCQQQRFLAAVRNRYLLRLHLHAGGVQVVITDSRRHRQSNRYTLCRVSISASNCSFRRSKISS